MHINIDNGISSMKVIIVSNSHGVIANKSESLTIESSSPSCLEQNQKDWWAVSCAFIARCAFVDSFIASYSKQMRQVCDIGLSGKMIGAQRKSGTCVSRKN